MSSPVENLKKTRSCVDLTRVGQGLPLSLLLRFLLMGVCLTSDCRLVTKLCWSHMTSYCGWFSSLYKQRVRQKRVDAKKRKAHVLFVFQHFQSVSLLNASGM
ncbi:hypothetical protein AVEN_113918-1 [Araneus ventricosus]|uniref:Uncharacterized protein n=1 Tax=Araneus ventricosus TaxID=182803 RepID=A0A4Y2L3Z1_ARAVE|nr:hypothetical protein AVEN_113918-1 [Araneus ventricosus]